MVFLWFKTPYRGNLRKGDINISKKSAECHLMQDYSYGITTHVSCKCNKHTELTYLVFVVWLCYRSYNITLRGKVYQSFTTGIFMLHTCFIDLILRLHTRLFSSKVLIKDHLRKNNGLYMFASIYYLTEKRP